MFPILRPCQPFRRGAHRDSIMTATTTTPTVRTESHGTYTPEGITAAAEDMVIAQAIEILRKRLHTPAAYLESPEAVRNFLRLQLAGEKSEVFGCLFLDTRHGVIAYEPIFQGSIDGASVYPRELVRRALSRNAAAVILVHNHPSGVVEPSQADRNLTVKLKEALALVEVRVLDHFIVGGNSEMGMHSAAEHGWI